MTGRPAATGVHGQAAPSPHEAGTDARGLEPLLRPRSVAVIGASRERGSIGAEIFHNLIAQGFQGPVYPVNPKAPVVQSVRAYPDIGSVPEAVDLAVIAVPAARVVETIEACGRKGVRAAVVISAGFKETGTEGAAREREMVACARRHHMRIVGPNCLGVLNTEPDVRLDATFAPTYPPHGAVAFSSQSGALGLAILEYAAALQIGISQFVSVGNKADVSSNDLLEFWEKDPGTRVVLLYLESFGNPRRFIHIARRVGRSKPIVAVKSGRTASGARAASSHTGSLAGADEAVTALCAQAGVIRTGTIEELFDVAMLLANQPVPRGHRVAIVTNAGGPGIMATDACERHGIEIPLLDPATVAGLRAFLPAEASTRNPVDMLASAAPETFERAVHLALADPNVDAALVIYVTPIVTRPLEVAQAIVRGARQALREASAAGMPPKPVATCFMGSHGVPEGLRSLHEGHIPSYAFPESAAIALARAVEYGRWLETPEGRGVHFADVDVVRAEGAIERARRRAEPGHPWMTASEVRDLLTAYGLTMPPAAIAASEEEAVRAAAELGHPVVLKVASDAVLHKSDIGGVALDLRRAGDVREAYRDIEQRFRAAHGSKLRFAVQVQPMVKGGVEVIMGMHRDPSFGPLIVFGLGGVQVEVLRDVVVRIAPLTDRDAHEMVRAVRGRVLLEGYRGAPPADLAALELSLLRLSQLVDEHPEIEEMDLNPLKAMAPGHGACVVDARVRVGEGA